MDKFKIITKNKINNLPKITGVYYFSEKSKVIYIGKAVNIKNRVKNHFQQPGYRDDLFIKKVDKIGFFETGSEIEALILEANLIKKYQPKFNVVWRDDKNYFYVAVAKNKQKIPYIFITHQPSIFNNRRPSIIRSWDKIKYIGPFVEGEALKKTLKFLRRVFPYYTASRHPKNKCAWCHLELCPGPALDLDDYEKNIKKLILILKGKRSSVLNLLKEEMKNFSKEREFEKAAKSRDEISALQQVMSHTRVIKSTQVQKTDDRRFSVPVMDWLLTQKTLKKITNSNKDIKKIECYDVSNIQGKHATGSMVVFINGKPDKNLYRKFRVKIEGKPNDTAMIKEILERRLKHAKWAYPEIILIDGGRAQLNTAIKTKEKSLTLSVRSHRQAQSLKNIKNAGNIKVTAIAKKNNELYVEGKNKPILLKTLPKEIFNLVLQMRDEAHRFAIAYHKKLRKNYLFK